MDPFKKTALIKWLDALTDKKTESFNDIRDGKSLITILKAFDDHFIPRDTPVDTVQQRFEAVRTYLEGFYHQSLSDNSLVNFDILIQNNIHGPVYDWEMGRLLLALLGALVQDKYREQFVNPAFTMDERSQMELKTMIESILFLNEVDTNLPREFDQVLKRRTDTPVEHGAAWFFKQVAGGMCLSPQVDRSATTTLNQVDTSTLASSPRPHDKGPVCSLYTNSPGGAAASPGMSIREISSPLRVMSLNSPASSPLGALMQSPQLAQKIIQRESDKRRESEALLRQKMQEIKRLEMSLQHQEHLRSEMELDIEERGKTLKDKDKRIWELERQVSELRSLRDDLDELEQLKADKEKLAKDNSRLQAKLKEYQDIREHCQVLERENQEALAEIQRIRKEQKDADEMQRKNEELQHELHCLQLLVKEHETEIEHRKQLNTELTASLEEMKSRCTVAQQQVMSLRMEKEELEEFLGTRAGMNGLQSPLGESMNVVVEKKLSELQIEYEKMKNTWIDPAIYSEVKKNLESELQARQTIEAKYFETTKKFLACEDEVQKLTTANKQYESSIKELETSLQEEQNTNKGLQSEIDRLAEHQETLEKTISDLQSVKEEQETKIQSLQKELSQSRTELVLTRKEVEVQQEASEIRRQTIAQLDSEKLEQMRVEQRLSAEVSLWKSKSEEALKQVKDLKKELTSSEEKLKTKMDELSQLEKQLISETDQLSADIEVWKAKAEETRVQLQALQTESENKIKCLQTAEVKLSEELSECKEKIQRLDQEKHQICSELEQWKCKAGENEEKFEKLQTVSSEKMKTFQQEEKQILIELNMWKAQAEETEKQLNEKMNEVSCRDEMITAINNKLKELEQRYYTEVDQLNLEVKTWKSKASREADDYVRSKVKLSDEISSLQKSELQLNSELELWRKRVDDCKEQIKSLKNERSISEEKWKAKLDSFEHRLTGRETQIIENENHISNLKTKIGEIENELKETEAKYRDDKKLQMEKLESLEVKLKFEKNLNDDKAEQIRSLTEELEENKSSYLKQEESLQAEKKSLELDLHKTKLELQSAIDSYNSKFQKNELKLKDTESVFTQEVEKLKVNLEQQYQVEKNLKNEISRLNQVIEKHKEDIENLRKVVEKLKREKDVLSGEFEESKLVSVDLEVKLKTLQETYDHDNEQNLETIRKKESINNELEKTLEMKVKEFDAEKTDMMQQLNSLHQAVAEKSKECLHQKETLLEEIRTLKANHDSVVAEMKIQHSNFLSEKDAEVNNMKRKLEEITESMELKLSGINEIVMEKDQNMDKMKTEYETMIEEKNGEIAKLGECKAELELQFNNYRAEAEAVRSTMKSELEKANIAQEETEEDLKSLKETAQSEAASLKEKLVETENYWRSQCEQLEEEYCKGAAEQKEEYQQQLIKEEEKFEEKLQQLSDEKDMFIANQQQAYTERIQGLERAINEKKEEIHCAEIEKEKLKDSFEAERAQFEKQIEELMEKIREANEKHTIESDELKSVQQEVVMLTETHKAEIERLECQSREELVKLKQNLCCENTEVVKQLTEQHESELNKLRSDHEEQKSVYQSMLSDLEGRLDCETSELKERLSQMKCQYEMIIETNQKEQRNQNRESEKKLTEAKNKIADLENELLKQTQTVETLQNQCSSYTSSSSELQLRLEQMQADKSGLESRISEFEEHMKSLNDKLGTLETDLKSSKEDVLRERGEREEIERQLSYLRDQNDTLSAELSSQQQQLAAVEEEKRVLEVERSQLHASHTSSLEDIKVKAEKDLNFINIEKMELERQLQSSQKCYEAVQKSEKELENQLEKLQHEKVQTEDRLRELEQRVFSYMEREKKITQDNQHQVDKAAELNGTLRRQLDEKCREVSDLNRKFTMEVDGMQEQFSSMKRSYEADIQKIREEKTKLEIEVASLDKVKEKLQETEAERRKLQDINEKYNIHYNKKKETIASLTQELDVKRQEVDELTRINDKLVKDVAPLREKYEGEMMKNKGLNNKVRTLEAQLDLADRKIQEYRSEAEKTSSVFLGDNTEFMKMISSRKNAADASFMENHPSSGLLQEPDNENNGTAYDLRPRHSSTDSLFDDTLTPGSRASRSRLRLRKSLSAATVTSNGMTPGAASIGSASSLVYRLRSRESAASLSSLNSLKSTNSAVPRGTGGLWMCEDEPTDLEWGRLSELQRRNTMCPAHLKTSYPVETQTCKPAKFREDALRESTMGNATLQLADHGSGRKRKHQHRDDSSSESSDNRSKLAKAGSHGTVYQKPGPPTPANQRRNSGKGTSRSPNSRRNSGKGSRSPRTPVSLRGRRTPGRRTPKNTPKGAASLVSNLENTGSGKKASKRESVAFSVGFSPVSKKSLRRQHGFIQKQPQSTSQIQPRKPLGVRNCQETGV